ncbi:MAG: TfoX/Sxy family protein [Thaumarchaeota archaeon]|nr:TfoX/Sxy family protein [Nitrososphaerota archaeon]
MDKMPRSSKQSEALLRSLLPEGKDVALRPMFGNLSAFVRGNMFMGVFGDDLLVRLSESDRAELLRVEGAAVFEPMKGRQMKEYVVVPRSWTRDPAKIKPWVTRSLDWSSKLPAKKPKR